MTAEPQDFFRAFRQVRRELRQLTAETATVGTSNRLFNEMVSRSSSDLGMLLTNTEHGLYPYAGIPWYSTAFGRDGIITAMQMLWWDPSVAKGVLTYLAANQAQENDPAADANPGKILHEMRAGEMALCNEVPFRRYYGTVDATPLFLMLAGMYLERTGDLGTIAGIWKNLEAALHWIDEYGDRDGDGFVEYERETEAGLANQGWKDSHDAIFHADGSEARGPIALVEVQAYVYAAKRSAATIAAALERRALSRHLESDAEELRARFEAAFWVEEIGTYALALDGEKRQCQVRTSNAGHALFAGIASPDRAIRVARTLLSADCFSGWGIRTLGRKEARFNPMSYHNGSVWPHDNAIIALGFGRYALKQEAVRVFEGMYAAANYLDQRRLPELFCGFLRRHRRGPTAYPVACAPQAWAAATPFAFLASCLGLELIEQTGEVRLHDPVLPDFLDQVLIRHLRLGRSVLDLQIDRREGDVAVNVLARKGDARVLILR